MHVAAIVTIPGATNSLPPGGAQLSGAQQALRLNSPIATWDLLGETLLERMLSRIRVFGIGEIAVISEDAVPGFWSEWDKIVSTYLNHGLKTLLLIRVGPYLELDLSDLLRFHRETSSPLTQVYGGQRPVDLVAVEAAQLRQGSGSFRNRLRMMIPRQQRYSFIGYANRLRDARDFRQLAVDALCGRAAIRPIGSEIRANVWLGDEARLDGLARVEAPAYIGKRSTVRSGASITGASTIEKDCEIDFATQIHDSSVLREIYIGAGLRVRGAVVGERRLLQLARSVQLDFSNSRLIGSTNSLGKILKNSGMSWSARKFIGRAACQPDNLQAHL